MSRVEIIAKMLGVEIGEDFNVESDRNTYKLDREHGLMILSDNQYVKIAYSVNAILGWTVIGTKALIYPNANKALEETYNSAIKHVYDDINDAINNYKAYAFFTSYDSRIVETVTSVLIRQGYLIETLQGAFADENKIRIRW